MPKSSKKKLEYMAEYQKKPENVQKRVKRNAARRKMIRLGLAHKGDGKDVDHKDFNTNNNARENLRVMSRSKNRGRKKE